MVLLASDFDQSRYFKAEDVATEKKLRIKNVSEELIGMGAEKEKKLVVWFTNDERGLVLNRTNNRTLRGAFGDAVDGWTNKIIVLFRTQADYRGRMVPALRVRIPPPKQAVGNGQTVPKSKAATPKPPVVDNELDAEVSAKSQSETAADFDDEIDF
jgi:hypothetical protein